MSVVNYALANYTVGTVPTYPGANFTDGCISMAAVTNQAFTQAVFANSPNASVACGPADLSSRYSRYFPAPAYFGAGNKTDFFVVRVTNTKVPTRRDDDLAAANPYYFTYTIPSIVPPPPTSTTGSTSATSAATASASTVSASVDPSASASAISSAATYVPPTAAYSVPPASTAATYKAPPASNLYKGAGETIILSGAAAAIAAFFF
ncbi:hypothetical protein BC830DRAFT_1135699 [Chytriomyces sp. MP71]|nr:hypothetical protein BC830DRAFT_1135699 [Chytriomyces sp. MP71]